MPRKPDKRQKFSISPEAHKRLRVEAARSGRTISYVLDRLIIDMLDPGFMADRIKDEGDRLKAGTMKRRRK